MTVNDRVCYHWLATSSPPLLDSNLSSKMLNMQVSELHQTAMGFNTVRFAGSSPLVVKTGLEKHHLHLFQPRAMDLQHQLMSKSYCSDRMHSCPPARDAHVCFKLGRFPWQHCAISLTFFLRLGYQGTSWQVCTCWLAYKKQPDHNPSTKLCTQINTKNNFVIHFNSFQCILIFTSPCYEPFSNRKEWV
jgi:hypothetical protein